MIRISKLADYAVIVLGALAKGDEPHLNASALAARTHLPEPTVAKVLKLLVKADLVKSIRGVYGGYTISNNLDFISIARVIEAIDGPITITQCADGSDNTCGHLGQCAMQGRWRGVNDTIKAALGEVKLADMMPNCISRESGNLKTPVFTGEAVQQ
jgi:FeS assembly SUF system regulator